jgi:hypothetical protein
MTSIIDDLELSVRASNVLRRRGRVNTVDDFMALTREDIMAQPYAGARTWKEIERMQTYLRTPHAAPALPTASTMTLRDAAALAVLTGIDGPWAADATALAKRAYEIADAFIAARETKEDDL